MVTLYGATGYWDIQKKQSYYTLHVAIIHLPVIVAVAVSFPAALLTVHWYNEPSVLVIIGNCNTGLLEMTTSSFLHSNTLSGPPRAEHVIVTEELKVVEIFSGDTSMLPSGDTV